MDLMLSISQRIAFTERVYENSQAELHLLQLIKVRSTQLLLSLFIKTHDEFLPVSSYRGEKRVVPAEGCTCLPCQKIKTV